MTGNRPQFSLDLGHELVVDLFAGGGGTSLGIEWALGRLVDVAVNHDPDAIAVHRTNHPGTRHFCESVFRVDPVEATGNQPVGLLWASPDCTHHSKAKGGKPVSARRRGLAWVVVKWARRTRPRCIGLENVEEFQDWGPVGLEGKPCKVRKGREFKKWVAQLERLGYTVEHRLLRGCDYGSPTIRRRLFVMARRDGRPIIWPKPSHAAPDDPRVKRGTMPAYRTAAECIDWDIPTRSIFGRDKPLAANTMTRIAKGVMREPVPTICAGATHAGLVAALMAPYYGSGSGETGRDLREPSPTVTARDRLQLITVDIDGAEYVITDIGMRMLQPRELFRAQGFPDTYVIDRTDDGRTLPKYVQVRLCGNSVCPQVAAALVSANFAHEKAMRGAA